MRVVAWCLCSWLGSGLLHACQTETAKPPGDAALALLSSEDWAALSGPQPGPHEVWTKACGGERVGQEYVIQPPLVCGWHLDAQGQRSDTRRDCTLEDYCVGPDDCQARAGGVCVGHAYASCSYPELEVTEPCQADAECIRFPNGRCAPAIEPGVELCYPNGECLPPRPPGSCLYPPLNQETCTDDSDCSSLAGGHCPRLMRGPECQYNECAADADCGPLARCHCADVARCLPADCFQDADCGEGYRCVASPPVQCGNISPPVGYYCHGPADACQSDADCGGNACSYDPALGAWACGEICYTR